MIVSHKYKCVYMAVPKTGTTSVRRALDMIGGEPFVWGDEEGEWEFPVNVPQRSALKHICCVPAELAGYCVFGSVRNPYSRQVSRYLESIKNRRDPSQSHFEEFTLGGKTSYRSSCRGWLDGSVPKGCVPFEVNHILKMETIEEDFNGLPFVSKEIEFPHDNISKGSSEGLHFTVEMKRKLSRVCEKDFELFGYDDLSFIKMI